MLPPRSIDDQIYQDAIDEALDRGEVRWLPATWQDPACLSGDVDVEYQEGQPELGEEGEDVGIYSVIAKATVGRRIVFIRRYEFNDKRILTWEDE